MAGLKAALKRLLDRHAPKLWSKYEFWKLRNTEPEIQLLPQLCRKNGLSVDIGANKGLYCAFLLPVSGKIAAFEPLPALAQRLQRIFGPRISLHRVALSDRSGTCEIRLPRGNPSWATIDPHNSLELATAEIESLSVPMRKLDEFDLQDVALIKVDVEGHEESVIRGALGTIEKWKPALLVEIEERHNSGAIRRVNDLLSSLGYRCMFLDEGTLRSISEFDPAVDQNVTHVGERGKTGRYINNFIFLPPAFAGLTEGARI